MFVVTEGGICGFCFCVNLLQRVVKVLSVSDFTGIPVGAEFDFSVAVTGDDQVRHLQDIAVGIYEPFD